MSRKHPQELMLIHAESTDPWSTLAVCPHTGSTIWNYKGSELQNQAASSACLCGDYVMLPLQRKPLVHTLGVQIQSRSHVRNTTPGVVTCLCAHPSAQILVGAIEERIYTWIVSTGHLVSVINAHYQPISDVHFNSDGSLLVSVGCDGAVHIWSLADLMSSNNNTVSKRQPCLSWPSAHSLRVNSLFVTGSGMDVRVLTAANDRTVKLHSTSASCSSNSELLCVTFDCVPSCAVMDAAETRMFVASSDGPIVLINLFRQPAVRERHVITAGDGSLDSPLFKGHECTVHQLCVNFDSTLLCSGDNSGCVRVWHIASRQSLRRIQMKGPIRTLVNILSDGKWTDDAYRTTQPVHALHKNVCSAHEMKWPLVVDDIDLVAREMKRLDNEWELLDEKLTTADVHPLDYFDSNPTEVRARPGVSANQSTGSDDDDISRLRLELEAAKKANKELYDFAVKSVLRT